MSAIKETILFDAKNRKNTKALAFLSKRRNIRPANNRKSKKPQSVSQIRQKLEDFIEHSNVALFKAKAVFPFDFFPNEISIDANQVNIVFKEFFWTERVHSIAIENIMDIYIDLGPFFATIHIVDAGFVDNVVTVKYLTRKSATKARRIIQGLMIAKKEDIDVSSLEHNELVKRLEKLGGTKEIGM